MSPSFRVRGSARVISADDFGVAALPRVVDTITSELLARLRRAGFKERDYSPGIAPPHTVTPGRDFFEAVTREIFGTDAPRVLKAADNPIYATGLMRDERPPREEDIVVDDGGTIANASPVLKIAVRDANGRNRELDREVCSLLSEHSISPYVAMQGCAGDAGTVVYAIKRDPYLEY